MARETPERLVWAVEMLAVAPADRLMEIGCGQGVAVSLVCDRLDSGSITAIDRSEKMIALARKRNSSHISSGKATFQAVDWNDVDPGAKPFNKIFAVNVNMFWTQPGSGLSKIRGLLAPGGTLRLFYQPPAAQKTAEIVDKVTRALQDNGFTISEVLYKELKPTPAVGIIAAPVLQSFQAS